LRQFISKSSIWWTIAIGLILIAGCAGSRVMVAGVEFTFNNSKTINLMPFNTTYDREFYSDADKGYGHEIPAGRIAGAINGRSQQYIYHFDEVDLKNLRTSILTSLAETNNFSEVNDIQALNDEKVSQGLRLYIDFEKMGASQNVEFICEITAHAKLCDSSDKIIAEKDILVHDKGAMNLMAATNNTVAKFILAIEDLIKRRS